MSIIEEQKSPKVWWVQCKPFAPEKRKSGDEDLQRFQDECLKGRFFGMGWREEKNEVTFVANEGKPFNWETASLFKTLVRNRNFSGAQNKYGEIESGHVAFTKLNDVYYAGIIQNPPKVSSNKNLTWEANVEKWNKIGNKEALPVHVWGKLSGKKYHGTIAEIDGLSAYTILQLAGVGCPAKRIDQNNFHTAFGPEDLEDLMAHYMAEKNKGYIFLPSSCKTNTPGIEYIMYDPKTCEMIACQVKVDKEIDASVFQNESYKKYKTIYLFSGKEDKNKGPFDKTRIQTVTAEDLYKQLRSNRYLSSIVEKYFEFDF